MEILYSGYDNFATGHGCATAYSVEGDNLILTTSHIPVYELHQMTPAIYGTDQILSMEYLASTDKRTLIRELSSWISDYENTVWNKSFINV